jgi:hypothetical protein
MTDWADAVILLIAMVGFFAVVGVIQALITIGSWVVSHYRKSTGLSRW